MPCTCESDTSIAARLCNLENIVAKLPNGDDLFTTKVLIQNFNEKNEKVLYSDVNATITAAFTFSGHYPTITAKHSGSSSDVATMCDISTAISELKGNIPSIVQQEIGTLKEDITKAYKAADNQLVENYTKADEAITKEYKEADTLIKAEIVNAKSEITNDYTEADKTVLTKTVLLESEKQQVIKSKIKFDDDVEFAKSPLSGNVAYIDKTNTFTEDQNFDKDVYAKGTFRADKGGTFYKGLDVFSDNLNVNEGNLNVPKGTISGTLLKLTENTDPSVLDAAHCTKLCVLKKASEAREDINYDFYVDEDKTAYFGGEVTFKKINFPEDFKTKGRLHASDVDPQEKLEATAYMLGMDLNNLGISYSDTD